MQVKITASVEFHVFWDTIPKWAVGHLRIHRGGPVYNGIFRLNVQKLIAAQVGIGTLSIHLQVMR